MRYAGEMSKEALSKRSRIGSWKEPEPIPKPPANFVGWRKARRFNCEICSERASPAAKWEKIVNWEHFRAVLWLRWRLRFNQIKKGGVLQAVILGILTAAAILGGAALLVFSFIAGMML